MHRSWTCKNTATIQVPFYPECHNWKPRNQRLSPPPMWVSLPLMHFIKCSWLHSLFPFSVDTFLKSLVMTKAMPATCGLYPFPILEHCTVTAAAQQTFPLQLVFSVVWFVLFIDTAETAGCWLHLDSATTRIPGRQAQVPLRSPNHKGADIKELQSAD